MGGGLIQIASYGIHDIYLIGNPQITFFKTVYKKYCNFSMEYLEETLNNDINFGSEFNLVLPKSGDLLHKMYIKIELPQVAINRLLYGANNTNTFTIIYNEYKTKYDLIINFINFINFNLLVPLQNYINVSSLRYSELNHRYKLIYSRINYSSELTKLLNTYIIFNDTFSIPLYIKKLLITETSVYKISKNASTYMINILDFDYYFTNYITVSSSNVITDMNKLINNYLLQLTTIKEHLSKQLNNYSDLNNISQRENINFAWVEYIGHQIINRINIEIGGKQIDFTDAIRMNIHYQLTTKILHEQTYNKLLGNINELTAFNSNIKPSYLLYVPIDFWFCKYSGLSLPLIFLRYHDVKINIKLNNLIDCCYFEQLNSSTYIEDIVKISNISLIINNIYLDTDERKKFAQLTHEYLIDQTQIIRYTDITSSTINVELPFFNPIKQLFWVIRDTTNIQRLKFFDYSCSFYVDIYKFNNNITTDIQSLSKSNLIQIETTNYNLNQKISIGDTIKISNSIYYNGNYIVIYIENQYLYIIFSYYIEESYSNFYNKTLNSYTQTSTYLANSNAFIYKYIETNPINTTTIELNSVTIIDKKQSIYNNFVQPYQFNSKSPNFGLNSYSFALYPEEQQPSGFCNFNKLDIINMILNLNTDYIDQVSNKKKLELIIYAFSYNILELSNGKAKLLFNL